METLGLYSIALETIFPLQRSHPLQKSLEDVLPNPARRVFVAFKLPFAPEGLVPLTLGYLIHSGKHIIKIRQIGKLHFSHKLTSGYTELLTLICIGQKTCVWKCSYLTK